jgi:hypothetical protein
MICQIDRFGEIDGVVFDFDLSACHHMNGKRSHCELTWDMSGIRASRSSGFPGLVDST